MGQDETATLVTGSAICSCAADILRDYGWTQGAHARDGKGMAVRITGPDARKFSAYGAVMRAMASFGLIHRLGDDKAVQGYQPMWNVLTRQAVNRRGDMTGFSYRHPMFDFNDAEGRSVEIVIEYLRDCADLLKTLEKGKI